jgi:hypothetical protein
MDYDSVKVFFGNSLLGEFNTNKIIDITDNILNIKFNIRTFFNSKYFIKRCIKRKIKKKKLLFYLSYDNSIYPFRSKGRFPNGIYNIVYLKKL